MITDRAMEHMELIAQQVGFSLREDYAFRGTAVSAGDYKGSSTVAVAFAGRDKAEAFIEAVMPDLISYATGDNEAVETRVVLLDTEWTQGHGAVAIIIATDLAHKDDGLEDDEATPEELARALQSAP